MPHTRSCGLFDWYAIIEVPRVSIHTLGYHAILLPYRITCMADQTNQVVPVRLAGPTQFGRSTASGHLHIATAAAG